MIEALMQSLLRLPGMYDHTWSLSLLSALEVDARVWSMPIAPRCLHEHMAAVTVAGFRDRAESCAVATRIFPGYETQVACELRRTLESLIVAIRY